MLNDIVCVNNRCNKRKECYRAKEVNHMAEAIYSFCRYEKCPDNNYIEFIKIKGEENKMRIKNITDINGFFKQLEKCSGNVYLTTKDGDKLNLKSRLTQYVALTSVFDDGVIDDINIDFDSPDDVVLMMHYLIER